MKSKTILFPVILLMLILLITGCVNNSKNSDDNSNSGTWLDNYTPEYSIGTGDNNFWITFPLKNPSSGEEVDHLSWIVNDLKNKPVIYVVHRTGCAPCTPQAERVIALAEKYEEYVKFYDLDITGASQDTYTKINEVYMYDPNGPPGYIALTGVYTYIKDNGEVKIGWHTWEGNVGDSEMESWVKDIIYYYNINK